MIAELELVCDVTLLDGFVGAVEAVVELFSPCSDVDDAVVEVILFVVLPVVVVVVVVVVKTGT